MADRDRRIFDMWMACWTQEEIGAAVGCDHKTVGAVLGETATLPKLPKSESAAATHAVDFDDAAYMLLATANAQGELSPLEIGMHALRYVDKSSGGRGKEGGLSAYAEAVGKDRRNVERYRDAAEVAQNLGNDTQVSDILDKAAHLAALHARPQEVWSEAVKAMIDGCWSAKETADRVGAVALRLHPAPYMHVCLHHCENQ